MDSIVHGGPLMNTNQKRIVGLALKSRLPSMYQRREAVDAGGLMSYGADHAESYRRVAYYVDRILKGAKPADLPVEQPMKFEFVINLQTAKKIGLTIPPDLLARATKSFGEASRCERLDDDCPLSQRNFESMSKRAVELGEFERREGRYEMSQLTLEHQCEEIAADRAGAWQAVFQSQNDFGRESEDFPVHRGTDHSRQVFVFGDKSTGYDDVKPGLRAALGNALAGAVEFPSPHKRACSAISARPCRARRLRCLRNTAPSLASRACLRTLSAYWRSAVRTSAARLRRRDDVSASASRSFAVASSIAIIFIGRIISALLDCAQGFLSEAVMRSE